MGGGSLRGDVEGRYRARVFVRRHRFPSCLFSRERFFPEVSSEKGKDAGSSIEPLSRGDRERERERVVISLSRISSGIKLQFRPGQQPSMTYEF